MSDEDFIALNEEIASRAHHRLMAAFNMFCAGDEQGIPANAYRRFTGPHGASLAEFQAFGVIVSGRLALGDEHKFHVTAMTCPLHKAELSSVGKPAQTELPLQINPAQRGPTHD